MDAADQKDFIASQFREIHGVPSWISVTVEQTEAGPEAEAEETRILVAVDEKRSQEYSIPKKPDDINENDLRALSDAITKNVKIQHPFLSRIGGLFGWWVIFAGSFALFSVCPVCGQVGCPVGIGITGILAGFLALLKQYGKYLFLSLKEKISNTRKP